MQTRIDEFCKLVAQKTTTDNQIVEFIEQHDLDINHRHTEDTHAVDFAAQAGRFENVRFLIEIFHADLSSSEKPTGINLLQWAHFPQADPQTRIYISDIDSRLWERFNDGTNELHIYAYHGRIAEVLAILDHEPDRICDYAHDKYGPLYWANLANADTETEELTEMQVLLQTKMNEYKQRHADNKINMLHYYVGMIFASSANFHAFDEFDDFLRLCDELCVSNPEMKDKINIIQKCYFKDMKVNQDSLYQTINIAKFPADKMHYRNKLEKLRSHQRFIASTLQMLKVLESNNNTIYNKETNLVYIRSTLLIGVEHACQHYLDLLAPLVSADNKDWELLQKYLNIAFEYAELGKFHNDEISDKDLNTTLAIENRRNIMTKITKAQKSLEFYESVSKIVNTEIEIRRQPVKLLCLLVQEKTTTVEEVHEFLTKQPVDMNETIRFHRTIIDQAIIFSSTAVAIDLFENNPETFVVPANSKRQTVMQLLRRTDIDATTKDYLLAPERKLWELMGDGTTEIMVHALAGRLPLVLEMIAEDEERLIATNRRGENVFYWAYHSSLREDFKPVLLLITQNYSEKLVAARKWDMLLKVYQASEVFMNDCLSALERANGLRSSLDWFENIDGDKSKEYLAVKDYLYYQLSLAVFQIIEHDEKRYQKNCRESDALLINISYDGMRDELQLIINIGLSKSFLRQATQMVFEADELQWQMKQPKRQEKLLNTCVETLTLALNIIAAYPNSIEEVFDLRKQMNAELNMTKNKIDNLAEFSFQLHAVSSDSKDEKEYDFIRDAEETLRKSQAVLYTRLPSLFPVPSLSSTPTTITSYSIFKDAKDDKEDKKTNTSAKLPEVKPDQEDLLDAEDAEIDALLQMHRM